MSGAVKIWNEKMPNIITEKQISFISWWIFKMTINELLLACQKQVAKWNWDKIVFISNDDDWNGWHEIINSFVSKPETIENYDEFGDISRYYEYDQVVLLG